MSKTQTVLFIIKWKIYNFTTFSNNMFKVNNRNTRRRCEICSKFTIKTPEWRYWRRFGFFTVNFEHISHLVLVFLFFTPCSSVSIFNFEQVIAGWVRSWRDYTDLMYVQDVKITLFSKSLILCQAYLHCKTCQEQFTEFQRK